MKGTDIGKKCKINTNVDVDTFVGILCAEGDISVNFPLGFGVSDTDKELRKDIILLLNVLASNTERKESEILRKHNKYEVLNFPIQAYMFLINDYYARGYYKEREVQYHVSKKGKINWSRTIKTQKAYIQDSDIYYLDFVTKKSTLKENELITLIHEYCVYDSFDKVGWLFSGFMPKKPIIKYNPKRFISIIKNKFSHTFNDRNKILFRNMLAIIEFKGDKDADRNYKYGTYRFEYVWENMIDKVFGVDNKVDFFPKSKWNVFGKEFLNSALKPDTIMVFNDDVYVLDAKYYKYGETGRLGDLPESASINKQITYGEYISGQDKFREIYGANMKVYNAFLMPFNSLHGKFACNLNVLHIGEATSTWKINNKEYERIQGILLDVKHLMKINVKQEESEIKQLAELIQKAFIGSEN